MTKRADCISIQGTAARRRENSVRAAGCGRGWKVCRMTEMKLTKRMVAAVTKSDDLEIAGFAL